MERDLQHSIKDYRKIYKRLTDEHTEMNLDRKLSKLDLVVEEH